MNDTTTKVIFKVAHIKSCDANVITRMSTLRLLKRVLDVNHYEMKANMISKSDREVDLTLIDMNM